MSAGTPALESAEAAYLELALRGNLSRQADSLELASARATEEGARSVLGPQAKLTGGLSWADDPDGKTVTSMTGTAGVTQWVPTGGTASVAMSGTVSRTDPDNPPPLRSLDRDTSALTVSFKQPFLQGFGSGSSTLYQVRQAGVSRRTKFLSANGTGLSLLQQARVAFWNLVGTVATVQAQAQDSARTLRILEASRIQFRSGAASALDTLTAKANHGKALVALVQGRASLREGRRNLATIAHVDSVSIPQVDSLPEAEAGPSLPGVDSLLESAKTHAVDLAQAQVKIEGLQNEIAYRRWSRLPKLDGTVYGSTPLPGGNPAKDWTVGARLDLDVDLPNGAERAKYRAALLDLRAAQLRRASAVDEIRHQIERILDAHGTAMDQLALSVELAGLQRARLTASEVGYAAGSVSLLDLQATRMDWMNAVTAAWQAKASVKALEADLETRTGIGPARRGWIWEDR